MLVQGNKHKYKTPKKCSLVKTDTNSPFNQTCHTLFLNRADSVYVSTKQKILFSTLSQVTIFFTKFHIRKKMSTDDHNCNHL